MCREPFPIEAGTSRRLMLEALPLPSAAAMAGDCTWLSLPVRHGSARRLAIEAYHRVRQGV
jgi:hypothetical protein